MSTTIRVDEATHAELSALAAVRGKSLLETTRDAAEALRRQEFARTVRAQLAGLQADPVAWKHYLDEAEATAVPDGVA